MNSYEHDRQATTSVYNAHPSSPDVWWGEDGIDASLGLQPPLYEYLADVNQKED